MSLVIHSCLSKDPRGRYQSARDAANQLRWIHQEEPVETSSARGRKSRAPAALVPGLVGLVMGGAAVGLWLRAHEDASRRYVPRVSLANPVQLTTAIGSEQSPTFAPDGRRIAYASNQGGNWDIWVTQLPRGEPVDLTREQAGNERAPSWSPDGSTIAMYTDRDGGGYDVMSALGGTLRRVIAAKPIAQDYGAPSPQWSSDGSKLAAVVHEGGDAFVEIVDIGSLEARRVPLPGSHAFRLDLSWSPDERFFAYVDAVNNDADTTALWLMSASTGEASLLQNDAHSHWSPNWSSDGRTLYFTSNLGGTMDLWAQAIEETGRPRGEPVRLSIGVGIRDAVIAPDESRLAYSRGRGVTNVWRVPVRRSGVATWGQAEQLTYDEALVQFVSVSRDGERIFISSDRSGNPDIWMLESATGRLVQLTLSSTPDWYPELSREEDRIAFYSLRSGNRDVWVMPSTGGPARRVTTDESADVAPFWSPGGDEVAYTSFRSGNYDIWIQPLEDGEPRQVTFDRGNDFFPRWSPDGEHLYFSSNRPDGVFRLWRKALPDGEPEQVTRGAAYFFRFSEDGGRLYFTATADRAGDIWAFSLEEGSERPVTDLKGRRGTVYSDALAVSNGYLYFAWQEDLGDLWVMDIVREGG